MKLITCLVASTVAVVFAHTGACGPGPCASRLCELEAAWQSDPGLIVAEAS